MPENHSSPVETRTLGTTSTICCVNIEREQLLNIEVLRWLLAVMVFCVPHTKATKRTWRLFAALQEIVYKTITHGIQNDANSEHVDCNMERQASFTANRWESSQTENFVPYETKGRPTKFPI
eukprot:5774690-Amphidinium_carterae.2